MESTTSARALCCLMAIGAAFQVWKLQRICSGVIEASFFNDMGILSADRGRGGGWSKSNLSEKIY